MIRSGMGLSFCMQRYNRHVLAFSGLLIALLISQLALPTLVMCFGGNGHLAMETSHVPSQPSRPQEHGGPCFDAPVLVARSDDRPVTMLSGLAPSAPVPLRHIFAAFSSHAVSAFPFPHALAPQLFLASLRSVLLLI